MSTYEDNSETKQSEKSATIRDRAEWIIKSHIDNDLNDISTDILLQGVDKIIGHKEPHFARLTIIHDEIQNSGIYIPSTKENAINREELGQDSVKKIGNWWNEWNKLDQELTDRCIELRKSVSANQPQR